MNSTTVWLLCTSRDFLNNGRKLIEGGFLTHEINGVLILDPVCYPVGEAGHASGMRLATRD